MDGFRIPLGLWIDTGVDWIRDNLEWLLDTIAFVARWLVDSLTDVLVITPIPVVIIIFAATIVAIIVIVVIIVVI